MRMSRHPDETGFTLLEVMVVVVIIGILIAIAIPAFLGSRRRAQDRQAQALLRTGLGAQKVHYAEVQRYTEILPELEEIETNLLWDAPPAQAGVVTLESVSSEPGAEGQGVTLSTLSASGTLFCLVDMARSFSYAYTGLSEAGTHFGRVDGATASSRCDPSVSWEPTSAGWG